MCRWSEDEENATREGYRLAEEVPEREIVAISRTSGSVEEQCN